MVEGEVKPVQAEARKPVETDEVIIAKSKILNIPRTETIPIEGNEVMIVRSLTPLDFGAIWMERSEKAPGLAEGKIDPETLAMIIQAAVLEPKLTLEEAKMLRLDVFGKVLEAIARLSGRPMPKMGTEVPLLT